MGKPRLTPWLGAIVCGALLQAPSPADAGGIFGLFCRKKCDPCEQTCQECQTCKPKKQKFKCFNPPEPPRAPLGLSFAADPQAQFADNNQDDRFDNLEKDVTRLTLIVKQLVDQQGGGAGGGGAAAVPQAAPARAGLETKPEVPVEEQVPPGPIPASARVSSQKKSSQVQQAIIQKPEAAIDR